MTKKDCQNILKFIERYEQVNKRPASIVLYIKMNFDHEELINPIKDMEDKGYESETILESIKASLEFNKFI